MTPIFSALQLSWALWSWSIEFCGHLLSRLERLLSPSGCHSKDWAASTAKPRKIKIHRCVRCKTTACACCGNCWKLRKTSSSSFALLGVKYILLPQQSCSEKNQPSLSTSKMMVFFTIFVIFQLVAMIVQRVNADTGRASKLLGWICLFWFVGNVTPKIHWTGFQGNQWLIGAPELRHISEIIWLYDFVRNIGLHSHTWSQATYWTTWGYQHQHQQRFRRRWGEGCECCELVFNDKIIVNTVYVTSVHGHLQRSLRTFVGWHRHDVSWLHGLGASAV